MTERIASAIKKRSLFYKLMTIVVTSLILTVTIVMFMTMVLMQNSFTDLYASETELLLEQISNNYYEMHKEAVAILDMARDSRYCREFLTTEPGSSARDSQIIYNMKKSFQYENLLNDQTLSTLILLGKNGNVFVSNNDKRTMEVDELWKTEAVQEALEEPDSIHYKLMDERIVNSGLNSESIMATRILRTENKEVYGVAILVINMHDFQEYYDSILDKKTNTVMMINQDGTIFSSNDRSLIGTQNDSLLSSLKTHSSHASFKAGGKTIMSQYISFLDSYLVCVINDSQFFSQMSNWPLITAAAAVIIVITCILMYLILNSAFRPLEKMRTRMADIQEGDFEGHLEAEGEGEISELAVSYNYMLDGLKKYIDELMNVEKEKRLLEIHALQMQINPHFMYNTLTSFKFLVWQNKKEELLESLDAFISLLQATLGNKEEKITVSQEVQNLKNYVQILQIRFGSHISVHYNIDPRTEQCICPKLILQPFVENAFFHAFTEAQSGSIDIFSRFFQDHLIFEIIDNGKGMDLNRTLKKGSTFSGVGIRNVDERITLLYGRQYGVHIESMPESGTIVTIEIPAVIVGKDGINSKSEENSGDNFN